MKTKSKFSVFERTLSWLLSVVMVFGVLFVAPITSVTAYTSHSRDEAVVWAKSKIGSYIDLDGYPASNPYQCVDLIKAYYQYLGVSSVSGNGCDYSHNSLPNGWTRIQNSASFVPNPGDIVVWTDEGWKNGHVAIFLSGNTSSFTSIDQNWPQGSAVKEVYHSSYKYVWGVIRPDFGSNPFPGDEDTSYAVPVSLKAKYKDNTYDGSGNVESNRWIDAGDDCYIEKVYTNGFCHVEYPAGNTRRWAYAKASLFDIPKKVNKPSATYLDVAAGTHYTPTSFWWNKTANTDHYDIKIWKGTYWQGDAYKILWNIKETECSVYLPEGYYEAYVDSVNANGCTMSQNVVKFNVGAGQKVDRGTNFYAMIIRDKNWVPLADVDGNVVLKDNGNIVWHFSKTSDGGYKIKNVATGKYLDVSGGVDKDNQNVQTWEQNDSAAQIWYIYGRWSGEYFFKPKCTSNKVLDANPESNNAIIWTYYNDNDNQRFALWDDIKTYTVSYNMNGGSGSIGNQTKVQYSPLTLSGTKPTRTGYDFVGWNTNASATTAQYQPNGKYTADSGATLYAIWKANTYTISYNMNGGSGSIANQTKTYGQDLTLSSTKPTRTGYEFIGWNTNSSATSAQYQPNDKYTTNSGATLYAVWKKLAENTPQIIVENKTASAGSEVKVNVRVFQQ